MRKVPATFDFEKSLWKQNLTTLLDSMKLVGVLGLGQWWRQRLFSQNTELKFQLFDSKMLSPEKRETLSEQIIGEAQSFGIGQVEALEIEKMGLAKANQVVFYRARKLLTQNRTII